MLFLPRIDSTGTLIAGGIYGITRLRGNDFLFSALLLIGTSVAIASAGDANSADDGWRRTRHGWEHIATWGVSAADISSLNDQPLPLATLGPTIDGGVLGHPAAVAIGLLLLGSCTLLVPRLAIDRQRAPAV